MKEGRERREEGRRNEEGVCQPGFEPVMYDFTRVWIPLIIYFDYFDLEN